MLHHLADATIQVANLVNYNCHPDEDGNESTLLIFFHSGKKAVKTHMNFSIRWHFINSGVDM